MKVLHMISGGDKGGAKTSVFLLLLALSEEIDIEIACFTEGVFYQEVQELPVKSVLFKQKFRSDLSLISRLSKYVKTNGFDIVHAHGARANFISMMLKPFVNVPIVTTVHSDYKLDFTDGFIKRVFFTAFNKIALRTLDYYIGVSEDFKRMLIERGFDESRVFSVYNAVDFKRELSFCEKNEFLRRYNIEEKAHGKTLVGIIGRFDYVKGHDIFLKTAAEILKQRDDFLFLLAGEGPDEAALRKQAEGLGISDNVIFTGFVSDIFSFINAIDINVCTSRSETFPYMLLEGALLQKPTVSTKVGGIPELVIENETGLLAENENHAQLAEKIIFYAQNPQIAAEHGEKLYHFTKNNFSKEALQKKSIQIYNEILRKEKSAHRVFDIMLSGYYGYGNSGDDALLDAVIKSLRREREDLSICVLSRSPQETMKNYGVFSINRLNFFRVRRYMKRTRLIVYGGGSHMQDITSTRSLVYYTFLIHMAKFYGLGVMLYGNGIGPITKPRNAKKARKALDACDYISLRDPESLEYIKSIGVQNKNIAVSVDPVFSLDTADIPQMPPREKYFVVSLRPWQYNEPDFTEKIVDAINYATKKYKLTPLFIPFHEMDNAILQEAYDKTNGTAKDIKSVIPDYKAIMAYIAQAEFALCMRLHALIYAATVGVPIIGLVYDPKVSNFITYMNEDYQMPTSKIDTAALKTMIDQIMQNPQQSREKIARERERLRKLSGEDAKIAVKLLQGEI